MSALWPVLAVVALAWPSRVLGMLDGWPLNGRAEALLIGLAVPALLWFDRRPLAHPLLRTTIIALLAVKLVAVTLTPQGLCARFSTTAPFIGETHTIPVVEPQGWLRSWDVRADWRAESPQCTAILDRSYASTREFPAWFVNLVNAIRPDRADVSMALSGYVRVSDSGTFVLPIGEGMQVSAAIDGAPVASEQGAITASLAPGAHAIQVNASLRGDRWQLLPTWNGQDAWSAASFTRSEPGALDRVAFLFGAAITLLAGLVIAGWLFLALSAWRTEMPLLAWSLGASVLLGVAASIDGINRFGALVLAAAIAVPVSLERRNLKAAFLLVGVPWLTFFAVTALPTIGKVTSYSHDDWLAYQVAAYRIFMGGYWLEGGNLAFDYQPLYRWINGALHVVFGDSSAGEIFLDSSAMLIGALVAFAIVKSSVRTEAGFKWATGAAVAVLATFATGTTWYFVGRGLSETAGAGFGFLAAFFLLRGRLGRIRSLVAAGVFAGLMFYTRLNFLTAGLALVALLLPLRVPTAAGAVWQSLRRGRLMSAGVFYGVIALSIGLFMTRTWWYTGRFSALYGTSLKNNDIGLRVTTVFDGEVWQRIGHSVASMVFMNEPPQFDPRAVFVIAGTIVVLLAALQVPVLRRMPASLTLATLGMFVSALVVHTHHYPGRMSIPLVPLACAAAVIAARLVTERART
jgi:hypothetical protein